MEISKLKQFAQYARRFLRETVSARLNVVLAQESPARRENPKAIDRLEKQIKTHGEDQVVERVAYIWFNRFCALRFMDVNRYHRTSVLSPAEGQFQPEILAEVKMGAVDEEMIPQKTAEKITGLLQNTIPSQDPQNEAYRLIVVSVCNFWHKTMPFLFQRIDDYTELLMPDDLLSGNSIISYVREAMTSDACKDVEIIGWLYQFYISEKKDEVFAGLKKNKKVKPENIPAATQLFTPNWIVRYLVENSLGRLWMLNNPGSRLIDRMEYYIKSEQEETDFLVIQSPEEIKICDPACGSGHMLVYAFEILYAIYEEQGYDAPKIPQLILENNLYGIEIDERAGELAAFALCMKAREKYRRFFKKNIQPNICVLENITFKDHEVKSYLDAVNPDLFTMELSTLLYQFKEADNFGSLIRPELTNISDVLRLIDEKKVADDMFLQGIHNRVLKVLEQAEYLSPKYHVVVANPPYMGGRGMNGRLGQWVKENYPDTKSDLFSMFVERIIDWVPENGFMGFMTPFTWMFLRSYEKLRLEILNKNILYSLVQPSYTAFFQSAIVPICAYIINKRKDQNFKGSFFDLGYLGNASEQPKRFMEAKTNPNSEKFYLASASELMKIPGSPIAYWVSDRVREVFLNSDMLGDIASPRAGLATGDNTIYQKFWPEVSLNNIAFDCKSDIESQQRDEKWYPCNSGGNFRKWFGNNEVIVNWQYDGLELRNFRNKNGKLRSRPQNTQFYFKPGITWTKLSSSSFAARLRESCFVFDDTGRSAFPINSENIKPILGLLCSKLSSFILKIFNPSMSFTSGDISNLPILESTFTSDVTSIVDEIIELSKFDWNSYENSWNFTSLPILNNTWMVDIDKEVVFNQHYPLPPKLSETYKKLVARWQNMFIKMQSLEEDINRIFIKAYELQAELTPDVPLTEITLTCNPYYRYGNKKTDKERECLLLADTMKEFISYSVGCMFGRYSLDREGLILANQGETIENYLSRIPEPIFKPDDDNVIPIMDVDWFPDDIVERFKRFLKVTFGERHYTENLEFIEKAIGKDIRKFFLKDFYTYHIKMYKKRPLYWMFSSPKGSFNALIYMHRYRPDTVSIVLNDYLREFRTKLTARRDNLENISISTSASKREITKALKEIEKIKKVLDEIEEYERDTLYPLATKQIEINLDDGVKENYPKFGKALKKVAGLS